ncbi:hypothetical protein FKM82_016595 [Ascaphus truei]
MCLYLQNVMHLTLHDEDTISQNDALFTVLFDVGNVPIGKALRKTFLLNSKGKEDLEVEFKMQTIPSRPEKLLTNSVLVSREVSCLEVCIDKQKIPEHLHGKGLVLTVKNSGQKTHKMMLNPVDVPNHIESRCFHCIKKWEPELIANIEDVITIKDSPYGTLTVPLQSLSVGKEEKVELYASPAKPLELKLSAKDCTQKLDIRLGFDICSEEKNFLHKRSKVIAAALKKVLKLDRDLKEHEIPLIAITTTGGGTRAMTSLYGTLSGLKKLNLLDCVSYITGASGSTWAITKLYEDAEWSQKDLAVPIEDARRNVTKNKSSAFSLDRLSFYRDELNKRAEQGYKTSFTDFWGLLIESMFHDGVNETKLSDQQKALVRGQNPLPLCLAMNVKHIENTTVDFKEWCEFSPYEVGLLKYGAFIRSEQFGSEFFMGRLTKRLPESRICYLQGLWSNIFSISLMDAWYAAVSSDNFWHRFTRDNIQDLDGEEALRKKRTSPNLTSRLVKPAGLFGNTVREMLTNRPIDGEHHNFLKGFQIHKDYCQHKGFVAWEDTQLDNCPNQLTPSTEELCLVDSAYYINASFPPLLRKERKVDIILSFDYGLTGQFQSVEQTHSYCAQQDISFPKIELSKKDLENPKECHVFTNSGKPDVPVILHFPLVNDTFREFKAPGVKRSPEEMEDGVVPLSGMFTPYNLLNLTYNEQSFNQLLNLAEYNVQNSEELILQTLRDAIAQKQKSWTGATD